jgi:hypothetical protein
VRPCGECFFSPSQRNHHDLFAVCDRARTINHHVKHYIHLIISPPVCSITSSDSEDVDLDAEVRCLSLPTDDTSYMPSALLPSSSFSSSPYFYPTFHYHNTTCQPPPPSSFWTAPTTTITPPTTRAQLMHNSPCVHALCAISINRTQTHTLAPTHLPT